MKARKKWGTVLIVLGAVLTLAGAAATVLPMVDSAAVRSALGGLNDPGVSGVQAALQSVVRLCFQGNLILLGVGLVLLVAGVLLTVKAGQEAQRQEPIRKMEPQTLPQPEQPVVPRAKMPLIRCSACGTLNRANAFSCQHCGKLLGEQLPPGTEYAQFEPPESVRRRTSAKTLAQTIEAAGVQENAAAQPETTEKKDADSIEEILHSLEKDPVFNRAIPKPAAVPVPEAIEETSVHEAAESAPVLQPPVRSFVPATPLIVADESRAGSAKAELMMDEPTEPIAPLSPPPIPQPGHRRTARHGGVPLSEEEEQERSGSYVTFHFPDISLEDTVQAVNASERPETPEEAAPEEPSYEQNEKPAEAPVVQKHISSRVVSTVRSRHGA